MADLMKIVHGGVRSSSRSHLMHLSSKSSCFSNTGWGWSGGQALPLWWVSASYVTGRHSSRRQMYQLSSEASLGL